LVDVNMINSTYFQTLGTPVLGGRVFEGRDNSSGVPVAILNESAARMFFPAENPIGKRMKAVTAENWSEVVGVVGDAKDFSLDQIVSPVMYVPIAQSPSLDWVSITIRTDGDPSALAPALRREVAAIDDETPISDISSMETRLANSVAPRRLNAIVLSVFAGLALILAAVGVYGVISYSVEQCTQEIGVRLALGAERATILRMVISQALGLALFGTSIGLAGALGLARFFSSFLFGVNAADPVTFATVSVVVLAVALPACYIPARRATKVDPMVALRYE
jgi:putative ABC transport system permease protein